MVGLSVMFGWGIAELEIDCWLRANRGPGVTGVRFRNTSMIESCEASCWWFDTGC